MYFGAPMIDLFPLEIWWLISLHKTKRK